MHRYTSFSILNWNFFLSVVFFPSALTTCGGDISTTCSAPDHSSGTSEEEICSQTNQGVDSDWAWNPDAKHRCNIDRLSFKELQNRFGPAGLPPMYHEPVVISRGYDDDEEDAVRKEQFVFMTSMKNITAYFPDEFEVTLSSSNSFSEHRRNMPLASYIEETVSQETFPSQFSNETWYLFGETYTEEWVKFLHSYTLPPCRACSPDLSALAFGIGNKGSGVQWHFHGPGFSESIHGRKHWILYPKEEKPNYDPDFTSRYWMEHVYTNLDKEHLPWECTLSPGEMIYFPDGWHHATINLDPYTAFVSTFTTEHQFKQS